MSFACGWMAVAGACGRRTCAVAAQRQRAMALEVELAARFLVRVGRTQRQQRRAKMHESCALRRPSPCCSGSSRHCSELSAQHTPRATCCARPRSEGAFSCNTPLLSGFGFRRLVLHCRLATRGRRSRVCASVRVRVLRRGDPRDRLEDRQLSLSSKRHGLPAAILIEERAEDSACFRGPPMRGRSATPTAGRRGCAGCQPAARAQSCAGCMDAHVPPRQLRQEPTA